MTRLLALCALLFASAGLAGCAGGAGQDASKDGLAGRTESRIVEGEEAPTAGTAALRGRVVDDAALAVKNAMVSILGTELSAVTDSQGAFGFVNITPGRLTLRVVAESVYRIHEGQVDLPADAVTEVTVTLLPKEDRGAGYRPHLHDYWGTDTQVVLLDREYDLPKMSTWGQSFGPAGEVMSGTYSANAGSYWTFRPHDERADGRPPIVLPGTGELRVTLSWNEAEVDADAFLLGYQTAGTAKIAELPAFTNGATHTIELIPGDADNGHQGFSLWGFRVKLQARSPPNVMLGPIHVSMVMVRGEVPVDPPHEDRWGGNTSLVVRSFDSSYLVNSVALTSCGEIYNRLVLDDGQIVPPGANRMTLRFQWASSRAPGTPDDGTFVLGWKPADLPPDAPESDYLRVPPKSSVGTLQTFDFPLEARQTDAFYQLKSNWVFNLQRSDVRAGTGSTCVTNTEQAHTFRLEVIAYKDEAFA